ncbi:MAG: DsrE family protein [Cyclobacteriaceae bacterium]|nr:DsrE family protein [Cyclobacteriaceae bacterium]
MKSVLVVFLLAFSLHAVAQHEGVIDLKKHKIVMQFTNSDSVSQASVVNQVKNIRTAWPNAQIEVVCHGGGLDLLQSSKSKAAAEVAEWTGKGVVFAACNNTMTRRNLTKADLLAVAVVVPSAMIELTLKQEKGWAYVKGAH